MRSLDRDRQLVHIGRFLETAAEEVDGKLTGLTKPVYEDPAPFYPTVSTVRGEAYGDYFGQRVDYDITLTVDDPSFRVREADVLWVERPPREAPKSNDDGDGDEPAVDEGEPEVLSEEAVEDVKHDYVVRRVARKGSFTIIAAKRVDVSR